MEWKGRSFRDIGVDLLIVVTHECSIMVRLKVSKSQTRCETPMAVSVYVVKIAEAPFESICGPAQR